MLLEADIGVAILSGVAGTAGVVAVEGLKSVPSDLEDSTLMGEIEGAALDRPSVSVGRIVNSAMSGL